MAVKKKMKKHTKKRKPNKNKRLRLVVPILFIVAATSLVIYFFFYGYKLSLPKNPYTAIDSTTTNAEPENQAQQLPKPDSTELIKNDISEAIEHAISLLGITDNNVKSYNKDDTKYYKIYIDQARMDLNFANLIISGQIEIYHGTIESGKELYSGSRQILYIADSDNNKFVVTLVYSKNNTTSHSSKKLAVIVDDFGYFDSDHLQEFLDMDQGVTFSILPFEHYSQHVMNKAVKAGHETLIHMPMEPIDYPRHNPGPDAIYVHMSERDIRRTVQKYIKALPLCIGANNHMGSMVTSDAEVIRIVLEEVKKKDLFFLDSRTSQNSVAYNVARDMMIPTFENSMFLDTEPLNDSTYKAKFHRLEKMAESRSPMMVIAHCNTAKQLQYLKRFLKDAKAAGYELIPASQLFSKNLPEIL